MILLNNIVTHIRKNLFLIFFLVLNTPLAHAMVFDCNQIYGSYYNGSTYNSLRAYNPNTATLSAELAVLATNVPTGAINPVAAIAVDTILDSNGNRRIYYVENTGISARLFYHNGTTVINTGISLTVSPTTVGVVNSNGTTTTAPNSIVRMAFSPDGTLYIGDTQSKFYRFNPDRSGSGGTLSSLITINDLPSNGVNNFYRTQLSKSAGGDFAFDSAGRMYIVTYDPVSGVPTEFRAFQVPNPSSGSPTAYLLGRKPTTDTIAGLAFLSGSSFLYVQGSAGGESFRGDFGLQTITQIASVSTGSADLSSCSFPMLTPNITLKKVANNLTRPNATDVLAGDVVEYVITAENTGNLAAGNVTLVDPIPNGSSYVAGSTTLNGVAVGDDPGPTAPYANSSNPKSIGSSGQESGVLIINAGNAAVVKFRTIANQNNTQICNQAQLTHTSGLGNIASDDPSTPLIVGDATCTGYFPPTVGLDFTPDIVNTNQNSLLTITLGNQNNLPATLTANFVNSLPSGLVLADTNFGGSCTGTKTGTTGGNTITFGTGGVIPANGTCTITINVKSSTANVYTNSIPANSLQTNKTNNIASASAVLTVTNISLNKNFTPDRIPLNGNSVLTLTLSNVGATAATLTSPLVDNLPSGLVLANSTFGGTCVGTKSGTTGGTSVTFATGGTVPANGSCTITANITSNSANYYTNNLAVGALQTTQGRNPTATSADLWIFSQVSVSKSFSPSAISSGQTSVLTIHIDNPNWQDATLTANLVDTLPAGLRLVDANFGGSCSGTKSGTTGGNTITYANGSIVPAYGGCTITANVTGNTPGVYTNTILANSLQTNQGTYPTPASADLTIATASLQKNFNPAIIAKNGVSVLTITLGNASTSTITLTAPFVDYLPGNLKLANNIFGGTCTGAKSGTTGGTSITYANGAPIPAGGCTITANITGSIAGYYQNYLGVGALQTTAGQNPNDATADLEITDPPTISKYFSPENTAPNAPVFLTIVLTNPNTTATLTSDLVDTLPAGLTLADTNFGGSCRLAGTVSGTTGGNTIRLLAGSTIWGNSSCDIVATINNNGVIGSYVNNIPVNALQTNKGNNPAAATATLTVSGIGVTKTFDPYAVPVNTPTVLILTLKNDTGAPATLTANFDDNLPSGAVLFDANFGGTCPSAKVGSAGGNFVRYPAGAIIPVGGCTIRANVTSAQKGNYWNWIPANTLITNRGISPEGAGAGFKFVNSPRLRKQFSPSQINVGGTSQLKITLTNPNDITATLTANLIDTLPTGVVLASTPSTNCWGNVQGNIGGNTVTLDSGTGIPPNNSCNVTVNVTSNTIGSYLNNIPVNGLQTNAGGNTSAATATLTVSDIFVSKAFAPTQIPDQGTSVLTITLGNTSSTTATTLVNFIDSLPNGLTLLNNIFGGTCTGTKSGVAGGTTISYASGSTVPAGGCTITANITGVLAGDYTNRILANTLQTNKGNNLAEASATLKVIARPMLTKSFVPAAISLDETSAVTLTFSNSNNQDTLLTATLTDILPEGMVLSDTIFGGTCVGSVWGDSGDSRLFVGSGTRIPANGTCTVTANVKVASSGNYTNTIAAGDLQTDKGNNPNATVAVLTVSSLKISKNFNPNIIESGNISVLTIQLDMIPSNVNLTDTNGTQTNTTATLIANLVDNLPNGVTLANAIFGGTCTGTKSGTTGGTSVTYATGSTIPTGGCTITANVTGITPNIYTNNIPANALQTDQGNNPKAAVAELTIIPPPYVPITASKSFAPSAIQTNQISTLTITINNPNNFVVTGVHFTDNYPAQIQNISVPAASTNCTAGGVVPTITAAANGTSVNLTGGAIAANSSCIVSVRVTSQQNGTWTNTIPANGINTNNAGSNVDPISAILTVTTQPTIQGKVFNDNGIGTGGIANNGILDGTEIGINAVNIKLTDCNNTVLATTQTDGGGNYVLIVPPTVTSGMNVCIIETNLANYTSTGAQLGNTSGTYNRSTDTLNFIYNNLNYLNINFGDVEPNQWLVDNIKNVNPGENAYLPHTFIASTAGTVVFSSASIANAPNPAWTNLLYEDLNCDGVLSGNEPILNNKIVFANQVICVLNKITSPTNVKVGDQFVNTLTATFYYANISSNLTSSQVRTDTTRVGPASGLSLIKSVDKMLAKPGEYLTYTIEYRNDTPQPIGNITVNDNVPDYTVLVSLSNDVCCVNNGSACLGTPAQPLPAGVTACAANVSGTNISWSVNGALQSGASGLVKFRVKVEE